MRTIDLEEIKKRQAVIISAINYINNTLEGTKSKITKTEKELSPESGGCAGKGVPTGATPHSELEGAAVRIYP